MLTIETDRLVLRWPVLDDAPALAARRSDPQVAAMQSWEPPFSLDAARELIADVIRTDEPPIDGWSMFTCATREGVIVGDIALRLSWDGRAGEVGFTLASEHWGNGYATEAVAALVQWLFEERGATRASAQLHPDNHASAMVLERTGFQYEGRTVNSYWVGDDNSDDLLYGMSRAMWTEWVNRPTSPPGSVELVEVGPHNARAVRALRSHRSQRRFVAPMLNSFADALFPEVVDGAPLVPWMRAARADGEWVGFAMLALATDAHPEPYLWRFLIDRLHQRRGIGRRLLDLIVQECRARGHETLLTSWVDGKGSPRAFYERYGFVPTGNFLDGEVEARLTF